MKLSRIELHNFRSFSGSHVIDLSPDEKKVITVIIGKNNSGKTSLLEAVKWCLYGKGPDKKNRGTYINESMLRAAKKGKNNDFEVRVIIDFTHNTDHYRVQRSQVISPAENYKPKLVVAKTSQSGQTYKTLNYDNHDYQKMIEEVLAEDVHKYFFVDGDRISDFTAPTTSQTKDAIEDLLKLKHFDRSLKHISNINQKLKIRVAKEGAESLTERESKVYHSLMEKRDKDKKERDDLIGENEQIEKFINTIANQKAASEESKEFQNEIELLKLQVSHNDGQKKQKQSELAIHCSAGYLQFMQPYIGEMIDFLEESRDKGRLPKSYEDRLIKDILEPCLDGKLGNCICGTEISPNSIEYKNLKQLLSTAPSAKFNDIIGKLKIDLGNVKKLNNSYIGKIHKYRDEIDEYNRLIESDVNRINMLKKQIDEEALQNAPGLLKKEIEYTKTKEGNIEAIGKLNRSIELDSNEISQIEEKLSRLKTKNRRTQKLHAKEKLSSAAITAIDAVYSKYRQELRKKLESNIDDIFLNLFTAAENFKGFSIDENFNYDLLNRHGESWKLRLSNAQKKLFSLSFVIGLRLVADEEAPFFLDSPLGVVDHDHRKNFSRIVPDLSSQLILLMTDEEGTSEFLERIKSKIGQFWRIGYDARSNCSTLEQVS
jgi:DNA sulfur modification protein DndD